MAVLTGSAFFSEQTQMLPWNSIQINLDVVCPSLLNFEKNSFTMSERPINGSADDPTSLPGCDWSEEYTGYLGERPFLDICGPDNKHVIYSVGTELGDRMQRVAGGRGGGRGGEGDVGRGGGNEFRSHALAPTFIRIPHRTSRRPLSKCLRPFSFSKRIASPVWRRSSISTRTGKL